MPCPDKNTHPLKILLFLSTSDILNQERNLKMRINKKQTFKVFLFIGYLFCLYIGTLYFFQYDLLFLPDKRYKSPTAISLPQFHEQRIIGPDKIAVMNWYHEGDKNKPAVLFFHGNTGQISDFAPALVPIMNAGYSVLAMEYRNFGNTDGRISKEIVLQDAVNSFDFLKTQGHTRIVAYGYSFGTAFASALTSLRPIDGLILTAPCSSLKKIVSEKPVPFAQYLLKDTYPSDTYVQNYHGPLLIVHGTKDNIIPHPHSQVLYEKSKSPQKELHLVEGENHVSLFWYQRNIPFVLKFLNNLPDTKNTPR